MIVLPPKQYQHILIAFLILACIAFLSYIFFRIRNRKLKKENYYLALQQSFLKNHYEALENQVSLTKDFQQEIDRNMEMMKLFLNGNNVDMIEQYENELYTMYEQLKMTDYCENLMLNSILQNKIQLCKKKGIRIDIQMNNLQCNGIEDFDLLQLFQSIFEDAISACDLVEESKKSIILKCQNIVGNIMAQITFPDSSQQYERSLIHTTALRDILQKYDGELSCEIIDDRKSITYMLCRVQDDISKDIN